jgi:hypothetical protein
MTSGREKPDVCWADICWALPSKNTSQTSSWLNSGIFYAGSTRLLGLGTGRTGLHLLHPFRVSYCSATGATAWLDGFYRQGGMPSHGSSLHRFGGGLAE